MGTGSGSRAERLMENRSICGTLVAQNQHVAR